MKIQIFPVGLLGTNCYFLINESTNEILIIDPGAEGERLARKIEAKGYIPVAILLTHGHSDHTDGIEALREKYSNLKVYALDKEVEVLSDPRFNMSESIGLGEKRYPVDCTFTDGEVVTLADLEFKVIATPGHTPGSCCYYFEKNNILVSGDTLFHDSIGRTDFPGGSMEELISSIKNKLYVLPDKTRVLPGHMGTTEIGHEKAYNMFVR